jgi:hypothetical protein
MKKPTRFRIRASTCGVGCLGVIVLSVVVGSLYYASVGHYHPYVPPRPPLPVSNALNDYTAAGAVFRKNGETRPLEQAETRIRDLRGDVEAIRRLSPDRFLLSVKQKLVAKESSRAGSDASGVQ